jgi:parallel beta-helix repeat protein
VKYALLLLISLQCAALPLANGWVEGEGDFGNRRSIGRLATLLPFYETEDSTSFVYLRGLWDNDHVREGNIGLGHRWLCDWGVLGGYVFYDRRTVSHHNTHQQLTVGVERYTSCFEARLNGYLSLSGEREVQNTGLAKAIIREEQVRFLCRSNDHERALSGLDGEIGYRYCCVWLEAKLLVGGYWFDRERYERVAGLKGRAELSVNDLPYGAKLTLGVEGYGDDIRSGEVGAIVRLQVPFGGCPRRCDLCSRLYERIERLDILTRTRKSPLCESAALFKGREISQVVFASDLVDDVANADENALIIANGLFNVEETVAMNPGQILAGGGAELVMTGECPCGPGILTVPGVGGTVAGDISDPLIDVDTDGTVAGLTIEAVNVAVQATDAPRVMVMSNKITTTASNGYGIHLESAPLGELWDNRISTEDGEGIRLNSSNNCEVSGNTISTEDGFGIRLLDSDDCEVSSNRVSTEGGAFGIFLVDSNICKVRGNSVSTVGDDTQGIFLFSGNNCEVSGNNVSTEGDDADGIAVFDCDDCEVSGNSVSTENGGSGIAVFDSDDCEVNRNRISTSGMDAPGIHAEAGTDNLTATDNTIDTSGDDSDGIFLGGVSNAALSDNNIDVSGMNSIDVRIEP